MSGSTRLLPSDIVFPIRILGFVSHFIFGTFPHTWDRYLFIQTLFGASLSNEGISAERSETHSVFETLSIYH